MARLLLLTLAALSVAQSNAGLTRLEFQISARDLPDSDICCSPPVYPADGYAILHYSPSLFEDFYEVGRTRVLSDNVNPDWPETYGFNIPDNSTARFGIEVMDSDVDADDYLGYAEFTPDDVFRSFGHIYAQYLNAPKGDPYVIITALVNGTRIDVPDVKPAGPAPVHHGAFIRPNYRRATE